MTERNETPEQGTKRSDTQDETTKRFWSVYDDCAAAVKLIRKVSATVDALSGEYDAHESELSTLRVENERLRARLDYVGMLAKKHFGQSPVDSTPPEVTICAGINTLMAERDEARDHNDYLTPRYQDAMDMLATLHEQVDTIPPPKRRAARRSN